MPATNYESGKIDVAIVGGSNGGLTVAIGLLESLSTISFTIYESAQSFGEMSAGVFFHPNAIRAMDGIDPRVRAGFEAVATGNLYENRKNVYFDYRLGEGGEAGKLIAQPICKGRYAGVHRAKFLAELVKLIPTNRGNGSWILRGRQMGGFV